MTKILRFISEMDGKSVEISGDGRKTSCIYQCGLGKYIWGKDNKLYNIYFRRT